MPLKIPRFACNICQTPYEIPTIVPTKCKSLYPRQLAQEMWGYILYRQPLPRNIHRVTDLTEKYFWGINLVIGFRSATEKIFSDNYFGKMFLGGYGNSWGILFWANAQFCVCSLLSHYFCSTLPGINLCNGHPVIAPKNL